MLNNPLFLIILLPIIVDVVGTVTGQSKQYWKSHYKEINEAAPVFFLLKIHPFVFIFGTLLFWLPVTYFLTSILPIPLNLWATLALFAGHSYNSVNWLRTTQYNLGIFTKKDRVSITLSLLPMVIYILVIGYIASWGLIQYFTCNF